MADLLIDTDVCSMGLRSDPTFEDFYGPAIDGNRTVLSFMSVAEIEFGMLNRQWGESRKQRMREHLAANYVEYGVTSKVTRAWADLVWEAKSKGRVLKTADAWIAATAVALNIPLVTHNARDFSYLPSIQLITASGS